MEENMSNNVDLLKRLSLLEKEVFQKAPCLPCYGLYIEAGTQHVNNIFNDSA